MAAYYNEFDPYAAQWLRNLIAAGHIAPGDVDERSLTDVRPDDLRPYTQCHFFAGIGVWSHALRRAGWADDRPIWTGSCPCQPFSAAGKGAGFADERHLWPHWFHLITQCQPAVVVGEQVENAGDWLDLVSADLEAQGYAFGAAFLPAAGFGGAHIRSRNYWLAHSHIDGCDQAGSSIASARHDGFERNSAPRGLGNSEQPRLEGHTWHGDRGDEPGRIGANAARPVAAAGCAGGLANTEHDDRRPDEPGRHAQGRIVDGWDCQGIGRNGPAYAPMLGRHAVDWLFCRDGKWRPVGPGFFEVAYEIAARMGRLCPSATQEAERLIHEAARRFSTTSDDILRAMRPGTDAAHIQERKDRRAILACEATVLLTSLREHYGQVRSKPDADHGASEGRRVVESLRVLWRNGEVGNPPHQRGLEGQPARELADAMRVLSSSMARFAQAAGYPVQYANAPASFPLECGGQGPSQNRVGRLRAYGNALDAETATNFIQAVTEIV